MICCKNVVDVASFFFFFLWFYVFEIWIYNKNAEFELWKNSINGREIKIETTLGHKAKNIFSSFYLYYYLKNTKGITNFTI